VFNYSDSKLLDSPSQDIILFLNDSHFTLLEPVEPSTTIDTLVTENDKLDLENRQLAFMKIDPARFSTSVHEAYILDSNVALLEGHDVPSSEANSDENFTNKATNGKNCPHLYMMSTFSHLLYNISTIFAREIKGINYSFSLMY
jgi:hypothetical protein